MTVRRGAAGWCLALPVILFVTAASAAAADGEGLYLTDPRTGREVRVDQGEPLLHLAFFATWCPDCLDEFERLGDFADRWAEVGYRLVVVAVVERQTVERLKRFVESGDAPGRVLFDASGKLAAALRVSSVPTHVLLDSKAKEIARFDNAAAVAPVLDRRLGRTERRDE